jgi:hypothetical protein
MTVNIEKMRSDMAEQQRQAAIRQKWETRKFLISAVIAAAAFLGAGIAFGNYFTRQTPQTINVHLDAPVVQPATPK